MKRALALAGIVAGLFLIGYALFSRQSDEELIQAKLGLLAEAVQVSGEGQNVAVRALQLRGQFAEIFEKDVHAKIPELGSARQDRQALAALAARSTAYFTTLELTFRDVDIQLEAGGTGARVSAVAVVTGSPRRGNGPRREERDVSFKFFKSDEHGWRIAALQTTERQPR